MHLEKLVELVTINLERRKIKYQLFISFVLIFIYIHPTYSNENGKILAYAAGCYECHTTNPDKPFSGGYKIKTKYGIFISPNITKDKNYGIGKWSKKEFINAIKHGISPNSRPYYPVFPYNWYSIMDDNDILDIFEYLNSIPASNNINPSHTLKFPYNMREIMWVWRLINKTVSKNNTITNRGEYLVKSVGHCSACHSPRIWLSIIKDYSDLKGRPESLKLLNDGAPNISIDKINGIGKWTESDIVFFLQTGIKPNGDFAGKLMSKIIENGTTYLVEEDLHKIAHYLLSSKNK